MPVIIAGLAYEYEKSEPGVFEGAVILLLKSIIILQNLSFLLRIVIPGFLRTPCLVIDSEAPGGP